MGTSNSELGIGNWEWAVPKQQGTFSMKLQSERHKEKAVGGGGADRNEDEKREVFIYMERSLGDEEFSSTGVQVTSK